MILCCIEWVYEKVRVGYFQKLFLKIIQKNGNLKQIIKIQNILPFSKSNQNDKHHFTINSKTLENTKEYKYLGIVVNTKGTFYPVLNDLTCKAKRAIW